jgi:hypothetical protein
MGAAFPIRRSRCFPANGNKLLAWEFGHPGWLNERDSGFITTPVKEKLKFEVLAWTPLTKGTVIIPEDVKEASAEVAAAVRFIANRDQMMPRFAKDAMPAPVPAR